jgi:hypothetical protein
VAVAGAAEEQQQQQQLGVVMAEQEEGESTAPLARSAAVAAASCYRLEPTRLYCTNVDADARNCRALQKLVRAP